MRESVQKKHNSTSAAQQLAQMREKLASISERERVLRERSADREVYRYLLDSHRLTAGASFLGEQVLNISPSGVSEGGQLAA
ncbi:MULTISPECIES: hypothetical protein [unclassified Bradyrhizobium]|uniref:hypothetical protein n=1 Tax=unclassified Bradyrhizobium TaxID=2631580 RepID=UPI001FFA0DCB|nr:MULTISPECIES: hypothetical protein [unclassified Bradyrhizobium]MCK1712886.1 hypothetical protein [Bradyrhizobium sp. 143]MCK1730760.1 hypothetical protein [Bradyrhizobium sp. 142]